MPPTRTYIDVAAGLLTQEICDLPAVGTASPSDAPPGVTAGSLTLKLRALPTDPEDDEDGNRRFTRRVPPAVRAIAVSGARVWERQLMRASAEQLITEHTAAQIDALAAAQGFDSTPWVAKRRKVREWFAAQYPDLVNNWAASEATARTALEALTLIQLRRRARRWYVDPHGTAAVLIERLLSEWIYQAPSEP